MYWLLKSSCFELFDDGKYGIFLSQEIDRKDDIYWLLKSSCFNFSVVGNTVFFWVKKMMERWYLLVNEKFLFWTFRWWEIRSFYQPKSWWKDDTYLEFLSFPWYFGTWEIRFFVQWPLHKVLEKHKRKTPYIIVFSGDNKSVRERTF